MKLYFMLGLPTETDEDVLGIADLARKVYFAWREYTPNTKPGGADHGVHLLVRAQAPHRLPVGGPDPRGGVPAAGGPAAGRPEAGQVHHLQLARPADQLSGGHLLPGGPPPGRRAGVGLAARGQVGLLERVFRLPAVDGRPGRLRAGWGLLRATGSGRAGRGVPLVHASTPWSAPLSCGRSGSCATEPRPPRTAAPVAPAAGPTVC